MFGYSFRRVLLLLSVAAWMFGRWCVLPMRASAEAPSASVTLPRTLWRDTMKRLVALELRAKTCEGQKKVKDAELKEKESNLEAERNACASRLTTERLRHAQQIKSLRACPPPVACYVGLGICGAVAVGAGVGGYYIGRGAPK